MSTYNWQKFDWPHFSYDLEKIEESLFAIAEKTGLISGKLAHLAKDLQMEATIDLIIEEALKTSEIEGEYLNRSDLRSSIRNHLGLNLKIVPVHDKRAQGIIELMFDLRNNFKQALTKTKLFEWHSMLFLGNLNSKLNIAKWREHEEPMQIVSGHHGKWVVHYEAPPSKIVPEEMEKFISWFNNSAPGEPGALKFAPIRAAITHLYFESIHPFEDGNGRIGRALAEKALSQGLGYPALLSISRTIEAEKKTYYAALGTASKSNEITAWIYYFVNIILKAQIEFENQINFILKKAAFFASFKDVLNERQLKVVRRMWEAGIKGFEGGISAKKYMNIASTSKATATRDLQQLVSLQVIRQIGSGRSAHYELNT